MENSLTVYALSSGSSGNSILFSNGHASVLIDAGLPARDIVDRMVSVDINPMSLAAILVSHEHSDHVKGVGPLARRFKIPVVTNSRALGAVCKATGETHTEILNIGDILEIEGMSFQSFKVVHDAAAPVGYTVSFEKWKACCITDLGIFEDHLYEIMADANLVILESNHDKERLIQGPYPNFLKKRILGKYGHLSNDDACTVILNHSEREAMTTFWLAHLSDVNNTPALARKAVNDMISRNHLNNVKVDVALRDRVSVRWNSDEDWWQKTLF